MKPTPCVGPDCPHPSHVTDPDLALPVRHEKLARRVAELVTAELSPGMIPGILPSGHMLNFWQWLSPPGPTQYQTFMPCPVGPNLLEVQAWLDGRLRSIQLQLRANGQMLWTGTLRE